MHTVMLIASWTTCSCSPTSASWFFGPDCGVVKFTIIWLGADLCAMFYIEDIILGKLVEKNPSLNINVKELYATTSTEDGDETNVDEE